MRLLAGQVCDGTTRWAPPVTARDFNAVDKEATFGLPAAGASGGDGDKVTKPIQCSGCPLEKRGHGFIPGCVADKPLWMMDGTGQATKVVLPLLSSVNLAFVGEAPAWDELLAGFPFAGKAGKVLRNWAGRNAGVDFSEVMLDNTIRCVQPGNKLPDAETLRAAQKFCSQYDRWDEFLPQRDMMTYHPAALLRDPVPLPLVVHDVGRAHEWAEQGQRVRVLLGAVAMQRFHSYATHPGRWRGHYVLLEG